MKDSQSVIITKTAKEKAVADAVETMRKLMISPNKKELEALVADELHYGHSDGDVEDKSTFIETLLSGKSDFLSINLSAQTIDLYGDTAVVRHILTAETYDNKIHRNIKLMILSIWRFQTKNWKIVARQAVKML